MNEQSTWILFPSVTYANKAAYYFEKAAIHTRMERIPESVSGKGCGYRLLVKTSELGRALNLCQVHRIRLTDTMKA